MKILILISSLEGGGAERVANRLANGLSERHEVYIMPFSRAEKAFPLSERVRIVNAGIWDLRKNHGTWRYVTYLISLVYGYFRLSAFRLLSRPDVTLSFLNKLNLLNVFALGGGRKVMSERNNPKKKGKWAFRSASFAYRFADKVVFQTDTVRNMFPEMIRSKGVVIPNPVEVDCTSVFSDSRKIVTAGRLKGQKNHALLIRAFAVFALDHPDHTLHIYGKGPLLDELGRLVSGLSLESRVFLEGYRSDIHEAIRDAEQFVLSSDFEGMSNSLIEAMMMGLPCISTDYEGAGELLAGSGACLLTPVGDADALAVAMASLADNPSFRASLSVKAVEFSGRFSMERVLNEWEEVLRCMKK